MQTQQLKHWGRFVVIAVMLVGGLEGLWLFIGGNVSNGSFGGLLGSIFGLFGLFYFLNVVVAWGLWKQKTWSGPAAVALCLLQVFRVEGPRLAYWLANGAGAWFMSSPAGLQWVTNRTSGFHFARTWGFGPDLPDGPTYWGINVLAVTLAAGAWWTRPTSSHADALDESSHH